MLAMWKERAPEQVDALLRDTGYEVSSGERHGTHFVTFEWDDGITRMASLGITNTAATPDVSTETAIVTVRAAATTRARFIVEDLYDRRRSLKRAGEFLEQQIVAATRRAASYTEQSLTETYLLGRPD